jgi:outer membrane translocation and assembly module TamA
MLRAMFASAAISMAGQIATGIHLVEVRFNGDTRLDGVDLKKCAADLKSRTYEGPQWTDPLLERVRVQCFQDKGYFKVAVKASTQQLPDSGDTHQFVITFDIDAGPQYRLGDITFRNNHAVTNAKALRSLFPIKDGNILEREAIAKGLENLRYAYGQLGYINFTSLPATTFDDEKKLGFLEIDVDEGKQFYVSSIDIVGADPQVLNDLALKPGQIYNVRLVQLFLRKHLPRAEVNNPNIQHLLVNERDGTVALTFDFRSRPD